MAEEQTINITQLLLVLFLGVVAIRYFFFSSTSTRTSQSSSSANHTRIREADVERIQQMFPQIARRTIMWDLQRNGGSMAATTERILNGRGLESPPQTFQPPLPVSAPSSSTTNAKPAILKPAHPDLITRYNLASKVSNGDLAAEAEADGTGTPSGKTAWSQNRTERQALLQKRREEMILAARRKMQAKVAAEAGQGEVGSGQA